MNQTKLAIIPNKQKQGYSDLKKKAWTLDSWMKVVFMLNHKSALGNEKLLRWKTGEESRVCPQGGHSKAVESHQVINTQYWSK